MKEPFKPAVSHGFLTLRSGLYVPQASAAAQASSTASKRCSKQALPQASAAARKCCCEQKSHLEQAQLKALLQALPLLAAAAAAASARPCRHASVNFAAPIPSQAEVTMKKKEGRYARRGGVACTASLEKLKLDRTSACWCVLLLTAS